MHKVNKQVIELEVDNPEEALELERTVSSMMADGLTDELEKILDNVCPVNEYLILDKIEINLGSLQESDFENNFKDRLSFLFNEKIREEYIRVRNTEQNYSDIYTKNNIYSEEHLKHRAVRYKLIPEKDDLLNDTEYLVTIFLFFLEKGFLPWWGENISIKELEELLSRHIKKLNVSEIFAFISSDRIKIERLLFQFSEDFILKLFAGNTTYSIDELRNIIQGCSQLFQELFQPMISLREIKKILIYDLVASRRNWQNGKAFSDVIKDITSRISELVSLTNEEIACGVQLYIYSIINQRKVVPDIIISWFNDIKKQRYDSKRMIRSSFIRSLVKNHIINSSEGESGQIFLQVSPKGSDNINYIIKEIAKSIQDDSDIDIEMIIDKVIKERLEKINLLLKTDVISISDVSKEYYKLMMEVRNYIPDDKEYESKIKEVEGLLFTYLSESGIHVEELLQFEKIISSSPGLIYNLIKHDVDARLSDEKIRVKDKLLLKNESMAKNEAFEVYFVNNAGLVILAPFIKMLFEKLKYLNDGNFLSPEKATRGIYLLQRLVREDYMADEHNLLLNKILCGIDINYPIEKNVELLEEEKIQTDYVVESAIQHWKKLKGTSAEGFRETFLARDGKITETDYYWQLVIERKSYDVLLDSIPWLFSDIKYAWMNKQVRVEW